MKPYTLRQIRDGQSAGFRYQFNTIVIGPVSETTPGNCSADFVSAKYGAIGTLSGDADTVVVTCDQIAPPPPVTNADLSFVAVTK